jgi:TolA-binding protein
MNRPWPTIFVSHGAPDLLLQDLPARSFLAGFQSYPKNPRAPNALLKLGMSLNKLGQKQQACGAFAEVPKKYPAAADARNQALRELKRAGC